MTISEETATNKESATPSVGRAIDHWPAKPVEPLGEPYGANLRCRFINVDRPPKAWNDYILSEWILEKCTWIDFHPHTETAFVLEGELHIESEGESVILKPGDSARVNAGHLGRYSAPVYARMVTVYGPNPDGEESHSFKYNEL